MELAEMLQTISHDNLGHCQARTQIINWISQVRSHTINLITR